MAKKAEKKGETEAPKSPTVSLVEGAVPKFRKGSARDLYYQVYASNQGKTLAEVEELIAKNVPCTPKKGKLAGQQEPVAGWTRWFVRNGYIALTQPK